MPINSLSEQDRLILEELSKHPNPAVARRAQLLLDTIKGSTAREIADRLGISRGRVHFWRGRFQRNQMGIFPLRVSDHKGVVEITPEDSKPMIEELVPEEIAPVLIQPREEIGLLPSNTMAEAAIKVFSFYFAEMLNHEAGTIAGEDIEELHDMRVATRRLRAAWELFGPFFKPGISKRYKKGLQHIGRALGKVRDWDVFIDKAKKDIQLLSESDQQDLQPVLVRWGEERETARQELIKVLSSDEYHQFNRRFTKFITGPLQGALKPEQDFYDGQPLPPVVAIQDIAPGILYKRWGTVRAYDAIIDRATITQLHGLRIDVKRLHYSLNFFSEILGPEVKHALKSVKEMQDILGDLHDAEVACILLGKLLHDWETYQVGVNLMERENPGAVINYLSFKHKERHERLVGMTQAWKKFNNPELRKNLALAVASL